MDQESPVGTKKVVHAFHLQIAADNPRPVASFLQACFLIYRMGVVVTALPPGITSSILDLNTYQVPVRLGCSL